MVEYTVVERGQSNDIPADDVTLYEVILLLENEQKLSSQRKADRTDQSIERVGPEAVLKDYREVFSWLKNYQLDGMQSFHEEYIDE